jgi:hypothetical protein
MNRLLFAIMYPDKEILDVCVDILEKEFGSIKLIGEEYVFNFTRYYEEEFGRNLKKQIFVFEKTIEKHDLVKIRSRTGEIEQQLAKEDKRVVNIDPGYISETELALATRKGRDFKEELGEGIFVHKVLEFKNKEIITFRHTFADYRLEKNLEFFRKVV